MVRSHCSRTRLALMQPAVATAAATAAAPSSGTQQYQQRHAAAAVASAAASASKFGASAPFEGLVKALQASELHHRTVRRERFRGHQRRSGRWPADVQIRRLSTFRRPCKDAPGKRAASPCRPPRTFSGASAPIWEVAGGRRTSGGGRGQAMGVGARSTWKKLRWYLFGRDARSS